VRSLRGGRLATGPEAAKRVEHVHEAFRLRPSLGAVAPELGTELAYRLTKCAEGPRVLVDRHGERLRPANTTS
jgi:hypothetical protein